MSFPFLINSVLNDKKALGIILRAILYYTMPTYLTASYNSLPGLKAGTLEAGICSSSPVCGLRPVRALLNRGLLLTLLSASKKLRSNF
ncbi:hypothetical protein J2Y67_002089 [Neobacillus niacini]|nr:hypothetical protein [Neobacillus niacini]